MIFRQKAAVISITAYHFQNVTHDILPRCVITAAAVAPQRHAIILLIDATRGAKRKKMSKVTILAGKSTSYCLSTIDVPLSTPHLRLAHTTYAWHTMMNDDFRREGTNAAYDMNYFHTLRRLTANFEPLQPCCATLP